MQNDNSVYRDAILPEHRGNPLIEVLPQNSEAELKKIWRVKPYFDESERDKDKRYRRLCLSRLSDAFNWPLEIYLEFYYRVEEAIYSNYAAKNPLSPTTTHFRHFDNANSTIAQPKTGPFKAKGKVITLLGDSGVGKTTMIENVLGVYKQSYIHQDYQNNDLAGTLQVVYICVQCPATGSVKKMCQSIVIELEKAAGHPNPPGPKPSTSVESLMTIVERKVRENFVGIIVLDEIQHLKKTKQGREFLLGFLLNLVLSSGVVLIFSGNYEIEDFLVENLPVARRAESGGIVKMTSLSQRQWNGFMKIMWRYQWTSIPTLLTNEVSKLLFKLTQGNLDLAVRSFQEAQRIAIDSGAEFISLDIINDAFIKACEFSKNNITDPISRVQRANHQIENSKKKIDDTPLLEFCHPEWEDNIEAVMQQQLQLNSAPKLVLVDASTQECPIEVLREDGVAFSTIAEIVGG